MRQSDLIGFGGRVRTARLDHGWSVEEACRRAGINRITWNRLENGLPVRDVTLHAAARALGIILGERPHGVSVTEVAAARGELDSELARFTDAELLLELLTRTRLLAAAEVQGSAAQ